MRVDTIRLRNFKCYSEEEISLTNGVSVVHGVNGSGKSTLLEAVFFALYGSKALDDQTLDAVITTGEDETEIELEFTHEGKAYRIERHLKRRGERATTTKCLLETPDGPLEGARDVRHEVTRLLRMDADAFVNCAYVRQGEVNKLIHASPRERQAMIDDLLQLGALETYRERAADARLGVKDVLSEVRGQAQTLTEQIETKEQKGLHERLNGLESRRNEVRAERDRFEANQQEATETLERAESVLERHEETRTEIETLTESIETLREEITATTAERESLTAELRERKTEYETVEAERTALLEELQAPVDGPLAAEIERLETEAETLQAQINEVSGEITRLTTEQAQLTERADTLEAEATEARERAETLTAELEDERETIREREETLAALEDEIEETRAVFDDAPVEFGEAASLCDELTTQRAALQEAYTACTATIETTQAAIEEGEALLEAGKCPECGQPVEESPHVDVLEQRREELADKTAERETLEDELAAIDERIERAEQLRETERTVATLEERRATAKQLLTEKRESIADRSTRLRELRTRAEKRAEAAVEKRDAAETLTTEIEEHRETLGEYNAERKAVTDTLETLRQVTALDSRLEALETEIAGLREQRTNKQELTEARRTRLAEKRERKRELEAEFDATQISSARDEKANAEAYLEQVAEKLAELRTASEEVQNAIGAVKNELEELESLRSRLETVEARADHVESLYAEAETLQSTYGELRAELRQRNVETLERLLNETFELVYRNDSYAGIDLDGEYQLTVYQKDGEPLEPEQLSGGERALFNLSLRCAIYRLLAEGVEGAVSMPPLILDEPTVFLDSGHVTQLVTLIESMRTLGVEQIVVVSHDEELVGAADELISVEKDATSNRARLERGEPPEPALLASE